MTLDEIGRILPPALSKEENLSFLTQYFNTKDEDTKLKIVNGNLRLVLKMVIKNRDKYPGFDDDDLFQIGAIGLNDAVEGFDPNKGTQFSTYACLAIERKFDLYAQDKSRHAPTAMIHIDENISDENNNLLPDHILLPDKDDFVNDILNREEFFYLIKKSQDILNHQKRPVKPEYVSMLWEFLGIDPNNPQQSRVLTQAKYIPETYSSLAKKYNLNYTLVQSTLTRLLTIIKHGFENEPKLDKTTTPDVKNEQQYPFKEYIDFQAISKNQNEFYELVNMINYLFDISIIMDKQNAIDSFWEYYEIDPNKPNLEDLPLNSQAKDSLLEKMSRNKKINKTWILETIKELSQLVNNNIIFAFTKNTPSASQQIGSNQFERQ